MDKYTLLITRDGSYILPAEVYDRVKKAKSPLVEIVPGRIINTATQIRDIRLKNCGRNERNLLALYQTT